MAKFFAGLCALMVYGSLGAASIGATPREPTEPSREQAPVNVEVAKDIALHATSDATTAAPLQTISDEERERRQRVCDKIFSNCNDECKRFYDNRKLYYKLEPCRKRCSNENADCLKEIP